MARTPITKTVEAGVLLKARRRCCICFGLNRDTLIKQGQIAHLDQNSANSAEDNLAFLCFDHHDQYDSSTRQSKNFTVAEVKHFRAELHKAVSLAFGGAVTFGDATVPAPSIAGHYIRGGSYESAELKVELLADGRYHVSGTALWGTDREFGPNLGDLDFVGELTDGCITYAWQYGDGTEYKAKLKFLNRALDVTEENWVGMFGMNVNFSGLYERAA